MEAVGIGGIAVSEVVDLAKGTGAGIGIKTGALQGLDVAAQVVAQVFVVVVRSTYHGCIRIIVVRGSGESTEVIVAIAVNLGLAPAGAPGNLADVARFLDRTRCSADSQQLIVADVHVQEVIGIIVEGSRGRGGVGHGRGTLRRRIDSGGRVPVVDCREPALGVVELNNTI